MLGIGYGDDIGRAIDVVNRVLKEDPRVLADPAHLVAVSELANSSVKLVVRPWCKKEDYWPLRFDLMRKLKQEIERSGGSIPFPQRDVHLHRVDGAA